MRRATAIAIVVGIPATSGALLATIAAHVVRAEGVLPDRPLIGAIRPAPLPAAAEGQPAPGGVASSVSRATGP